MLSKKAKIGAAKKDTSKYDLTKQDDEIDNVSMKDEDVDFDEGANNNNNTIGTPN